MVTAITDEGLSGKDRALLEEHQNKAKALLGEAYTRVTEPYGGALRAIMDRSKVGLMAAVSQARKQMAGDEHGQSMLMAAAAELLQSAQAAARDAQGQLQL